MSKKESMQRRRAQDIRCQVKKEYEARIVELQEKVKTRDKVIVNLSNKLRDARAEIARLERRPQNVSSMECYVRTMLNDVIGGFGGEERSS